MEFVIHFSKKKALYKLNLAWKVQKSGLSVTAFCNKWGHEQSKEKGSRWVARGVVMSIQYVEPVKEK